MNPLWAAGGSLISGPYLRLSASYVTASAATTTA
jgi:hypothetical protein